MFIALTLSIYRDRITVLCRLHSTKALPLPPLSCPVLPLSLISPPIPRFCDTQNTRSVPRVWRVWTTAGVALHYSKGSKENAASTVLAIQMDEANRGALIAFLSYYRAIRRLECLV